MKVKSESEVSQSCLTLSDPMDFSLPVSSIHGIFQARVLEWGAIAFSKRKLSAKELMLLNCGVGEDSWESLDYKEIQPVHPIGRTDAEAESPILWPPGKN